LKIKEKGTKESLNRARNSNKGQLTVLNARKMEFTEAMKNTKSREIQRSAKYPKKNH